MRARFVLGGLAALMSIAAPAAGLTPAEKTLSLRVPDDVRTTCTVQEPPTWTTARLYCQLPAEALTLRYYAARTGEHLAAVYNAFAARVSPGVARADGCDRGILPGEGIWRDEQGVPAGRWMCWRLSSGTVGMMWTRPTAGVLTIALRSDGNHAALVAWFAAHRPTAADDDPAVTTAGSRFPDALDRRLLLDIGADVAASGCERTARSTTARWTNGITCPLPGGGQVVYRRYPGRVAMLSDYKPSIRRAGVALGTPASCASRAPAERTYPAGGPVRGRLACVTDASGRSRVEWVDFARRVRGVALAPGWDRPTLFGWWLTQPR